MQCERLNEDQLSVQSAFEEADLKYSKILLSVPLELHYFNEIYLRLLLFVGSKVVKCLDSWSSVAFMCFAVYVLFCHKRRKKNKITN